MQIQIGPHRCLIYAALYWYLACSRRSDNEAPTEENLMCQTVPWKPKEANSKIFAKENVAEYRKSRVYMSLCHWREAQTNLILLSASHTWQIIEYCVVQTLINFDELFPRDMLWKGLSTETQSVWIACERERSQRMMSWASADVVVRI